MLSTKSGQSIVLASCGFIASFTLIGVPYLERVKLIGVGLMRSEITLESP